MEPSDSSHSKSQQSGPAVSTAIADGQQGEVPDGSELFKLVESLLEQGPGARDVLCKAVETLTRGRTRLQVLHCQVGRKRDSALDHLAAQRVPVMLGGYTYGMLWISQDSENPAQQASADAAARSLAHACGCILFMLEQASLVRALTRDLPVEVLAPPTARQLEVLQLYAQGYGDDEIVNVLCISPETLKKHRQHLYERLGVHHLPEALLLAHTLHLVSYLT